MGAFPHRGKRLWRGVLVVHVSDYKVKSCLFMGGKIHDLCKLQQVKDVTHVKAVEIPTYNHLGCKAPHSQGTDGVNETCDELLGSRSAQGVAHDTYNDRGGKSGMALRSKFHLNGLHSVRDGDRYGVRAEVRPAMQHHSLFPPVGPKIMEKFKIFDGTQFGNNLPRLCNSHSVRSSGVRCHYYLFHFVR